MKLKAVSGTMLTLLLIGMLILAFNIQPAKAEATDHFGNLENPTNSTADPASVLEGIKVVYLSTFESTQDNEFQRFVELGATMSRLYPADIYNINLTYLQQFDVIYLACGFASWTHPYNLRDAIESKASVIKEYVSLGGGLIVEQPGVTDYVPNVLPYYIRVTDMWGPYDNTDIVIVDPTHPITQGLTDADMFGIADTVPLSEVDSHYHVLTKTRFSNCLALAVLEYGEGRIAFHLGNWQWPELVFIPASDIIIERVFKWVAGPLPTRYILTVHSIPAGVTFTVDGVSHTTPWSGAYSEGASVSLVMPKIHDGCVWSHWLEDGDPNRIKTITMVTNITLTGAFIRPPTPWELIYPTYNPLDIAELATPKMYVAAFDAAGNPMPNIWEYNATELGEEFIVKIMIDDLPESNSTSMNLPYRGCFFLGFRLFYNETLLEVVGEWNIDPEGWMAGFDSTPYIAGLSYEAGKTGFDWVSVPPYNPPYNATYGLWTMDPMVIGEIRFKVKMDAEWPETLECLLNLDETAVGSYVGVTPMGVIHLIRDGVYRFVTFPPPPPVGGKAIPIDKPIVKTELQIPWIWLSTIILPLVATVVFVKLKKKKQ